MGGMFSFVLFWLINRLLQWDSALSFAGVDSAREPGAIPLFLAAFTALFFVVGLVQNWVSRAFERQADLEALELTSDPEAFREMMKGLQTKNLSDIAPSWWAYLRSSHPPAAERLEFARSWERERTAASS